MATVFTLEAVFAKKGDALLLHYGPADDPSVILIDGGPRGTYNQTLRPRLEQLREELGIEDDDSLPFELVMVSHIDDDHIAGVIDLFEELVEARELQRPAPYLVETLWHNSFDDILNNPEEEIVSRMAATAASNDPGGLPLPHMSRESKAVVASTKQGRTLRNHARKLNVEVNDPFEGLIMAPADEAVEMSHGLFLSVLGPDRERVEEYRERWDEDLPEILADEEEAARAAAFEDDNPFNLASICVIAEMEDKKMLLTGDARGDFVLDWLKAADLLDDTGPFHVDILKLPHHGSIKNVEPIFFESITADHYVISGNGRHGNPRRETLAMIQNARGTDPYTVHFTTTADAHLHATTDEKKKSLGGVADWAAQVPVNCTVAFRPPDAEVFSVFVNLLDPVNVT